MRNIRNNIMHSANLEIDNCELKSYLAEMESLLGMISNLGSSQCHLNASSAVAKIKSLEAAVIISSEDEELLRMEILKELSREKDLALQAIEAKRQHITDIADKSVHAATAIGKRKDDGLVELQIKRDDIVQTFSQSSEKEMSELESKGKKLLSDIAQQQTEALSKIEGKTGERLKGTNDKINSRLDTIEGTIKDEQSNIKLLTDRADAVENEQKYMKDKMLSLEQEVSSIRQSVDAIDKSMNLQKGRLAYLQSKEELRNELCQYYKENYFFVPVTPSLKRQIGTIDDMCFNLTETEHAFLETQEKVKQYERYYGQFLTQPDLEEHSVFVGNTYRSAFFKRNNAYQNILITGAKRSGKSTWCWNLLYKWVNACARVEGNSAGSFLTDRNGGEDTLENRKSGENEDDAFLESFDIVLYIPLTNLSRCETVIDLIKKNTESPFFQNEEKLAELQEVLHSSYSKCLIIFDDLHNLPVRNPVNQGLEKQFYVSTTLANERHVTELDEDQFDRYISIKCVLNVRPLDVYVYQASEFFPSFKTNLELWNNNEKNLIGSTCFPKTKLFSGLPVFIVFLILNWHETRQIGQTRAMNYASTVDFIIHLAENDRTGTLRKLEKYETHRNLWSDAKVKLPECFEHLPKLKEYAGLILKLAECIFHAHFGVGKSDLNADELLFLYKMGLLIDKTADCEEKGKTYFEKYQIHECSFDAFLAALHLVVYTQNTNDDSRMSAFEAHCDTYDRLMQKKDILYFASGMDPRIVSSLSFRFYPCLKLEAEASHVFQNPFEKCTEEILAFSEEYPSVQYPIYTTTGHLSEFPGKTIWKCNYDSITEVYLDSKEIQKQDLIHLKQSKNVRTIHWSIPHINTETYQLAEVTTVLPSFHCLTSLSLSGTHSCWIPYCKKTQNIDLSICTHIQHLSLNGMSCRNVLVNAISLSSISVYDILQCAIKIEHSNIENDDESRDIYRRAGSTANSSKNVPNKKDEKNHEPQTSNARVEDTKRCQEKLALHSVENVKSESQGKTVVKNNASICTVTNSSDMKSSNVQSQTLQDEVSLKCIHIRCRLMVDSKLEINGSFRKFDGVVLNECRNSDVVVKFSFQDSFTKMSKPAISHIKSVQISKCEFTRFIYSVENFPKNIEAENDIRIDYMKYEHNARSGFHSNVNVNIKEVELQGLLDDFNIERPVKSKPDEDEITPEIDLSVDVTDIPKLSSVKLIESLGQMQGLVRLICKNLTRSLWEVLGEVLQKVVKLELLSIGNDKDLPVALFQNIKHIKSITKLVVSGKCQGTPNEKRTSNKRKAGLKELAMVLKDLHNVKFLDIKNLEIWPKYSMSCLAGAAPAVDTLACVIQSQNEIEAACSVLLNVPKLCNLDIACSASEDVEEVLLCLAQLRYLKHVSLTGMSFEESFPENPSLIDLSHLQSFRVDISNSWGDIPHIINYLPRLKNLTSLSIQAFLSRKSWAVLAMTLPQFLYLQTVELSSMPRRSMPVAIIESLVLIKSLRKLTLNFQFEFEKEINKAISRLGQLEVLEIVYQTLCEHADLSDLLKGLSKLVNLQELAINAHRWIEPKKYTDLADSLPCLLNIRKLSLGKIVRTPSVLLSLQHMTNLRHLYLPDLEPKEWPPLGQSLSYMASLESLETSVKEKEVPPPLQVYWKKYIETRTLPLEKDDDLSLIK